MDSPADLSSQITPEALRRALRLWDSTRQMGELPLAGLRIVARRRQAAGYSDTPAGRGLALRESLQAAVLALKPESGELDVADRRWRPYFILSEQYFNNRAPEWVAGQLCISRRTYYNEQEAALETVADLLRQQEEQAHTSRPGEYPAPETSPGSGASRSVAFLAPPRPAYPLVGREDILADVKSRLLAGSSPLALFGLPGVGKSSLAVELAHDPQVLACFCDGVLWAGLGRTPDLPALLTAWAAALGLPAETIRPADLAASARVLHAAIGMRRMLLIVDDAWEVEPALTFRLGGPHCAALLTTRLAHVAFDFAGEGALRLHELQAGQGLQLLAQAAPQAVSGNPEASASLVTAAGGLPLALVLMGRHLRRVGLDGQPRRLHEALDELHRAETRLGLTRVQSLLEQNPGLPEGTPASLQAIIGLSEMALPGEARQSLRALALFPPKPNTFSEEAALAVSAAALDVLDSLVDSGLAEAVPPGRLSLHQTISDYGRLQGTPPEAAQRYAAYFARFAQERSADLAALEADLENLLAALELAEREGYPAELLKASQSLHPYLMRRGFFRLDEHWLERAAALARQQGDQPMLAECLSALGAVKMRMGQYPAAQSLLEEGLSLACQYSLSQVQAECLRNLGNTCYYQGKYAPAREHFARALELYTRTSRRDGEARTLNSLGLVAYEQGGYAEAHQFLEQALDVGRQSGDVESQGVSLANLGLLLGDQGDYGGAVDRHRQALDIFRQAGNLRMEASALDNLGYVYSQLGWFAEARSCYEQALETFREIGSQQGVASALPFAALLLHMLGDAPAAQAQAAQALELAEELDDPYARGVALTVLGHALTDLERPDEAADCYRKAAGPWRASGQLHLASDPLAGLARLALQRGDLASAGEIVDETLEHLPAHNLDGALDPNWTYLTCLQVLQARRDARYASLLEQTHRQIMEQAERISDPGLRQSFLEKVPSRRRILDLQRGGPPAVDRPTSRRRG